MYGDSNFEEDTFEKVNLVIGNEVAIIGWVHTIWKVGKWIFVVLRTHTDTIQTLFEHNEDISKQMIDWISAIPEESIV